jgi:hypothetical protein
MSSTRWRRWVQFWWNRWGGRSRPKKRQRRSAGLTPRLEQLEGRLVPAVLTVNSLADSTAAGTALTLREAVLLVDGTLGRSLTSQEQAQVNGTLGSNDTIQFSLPAGPQTINLTLGVLTITNPVSIIGSGASSLTINGGSLDRVFLVGTIFTQNLNLVASIADLTIAGGSVVNATNNYGAGLLNFGTLTVSNSTITGNAAGSSGGGGIFNDGALTISSCTFSSNSVTNNGPGGGIENGTSATATVNNSLFTGNNALSGASGAAIANSGTLTVTSSTFTSNSANTNGGGIYNDSGGTLTLSSSTFSNNSGGSDGGAVDQDGTATISYCTFSGNSAASEGGAMDNKGTLVGLTNCTLYNNVAVSDGGGIKTSGAAQITNCTITDNRVTSGESGTFGGGICDIGSAAAIFNTIVAGNFAGAAPSTTANDIAGTVASSSSNNLIGTGGSGGLTGGVNKNQVGVANPGLGTLANNGGSTQTVDLQAGSPAIAQGNTALVTAGETDQRGFVRIVNGTVDIGAVEDQVTTTPPSNQGASAGSAATISLGLFADANSIAGPWSVAVNWGDGSAHTTFTATVQGALGGQSHTYQSSGTYTVTVTVTDSNQDASIDSFSVTIAAASNFAVAGFPSPVIQGTGSTFTVTAKNALGSVVTGYTGVVHFTSSDPNAALPADYTFVSSDQGKHVFSATLNTQGTQSIIATDTVNSFITGMESNITVNPANVPAIITVNSVADNSTPDNSLTLREAIALEDGTLGRALTQGEQAQIYGTLGNSDTIQFNLPAGSQTITLTGGALSITHPLTISGPGAASLTINGANLDRVFVVGTIFSQNLSLMASIAGLTISGGSAVTTTNNYGGGLLNFGTLTVNNTTFSSNTAAASGGGGIYNDGTLTLNNCNFTTDSVTSGGPGGGIQNPSPGTLTVNNCVFTGNTALSGGSGAGIANSGSATVTNSAFSSNNASTNGGGIFNSQTGTLTVTNCTFANNFGGSDGGGLDQDGTATVTNTTFTGNSAGSEGGAMDNRGTLLSFANCALVGNSAVSDGGGLATSGSAQVVNCTITGNRVTVGSSGVFGSGIYDGGIAAKVFNTLVAGNLRGTGTAADDIEGTLDASSSNNLIGTGGSGGLVNGNNNNQVGVSNPGLGTLASNGGPTQTVELLAGSPAIAHGSTANVTNGETDQRGFARVVNGAVDIGAVEDQVTILPASNQGAALGLATAVSLGSFADAASAAGPWTVAVNWGDSSAQTTFAVSAQGALGVQNHTYLATGAFTVSVTVTDMNHDTSAGTFQVVVGAPATHFLINSPATATAGVALRFTVTALDQFNNTALTYAGTVTFAASDSAAALPAGAALTSGVGTFSGTLRTASTQTLTVTDAATNSISGASNAITVSAAAANHYLVIGPSATTAGSGFRFTVTARDPFNNTATSYKGTVTFAASDSAAGLPQAALLASGVGFFSGTLKTAGSQTLTVTDSVSSSTLGASTVIVSAGLATHFLVNAASSFQAGQLTVFSVTAEDSYNNTAVSYAGTINFTTTAALFQMSNPSMLTSGFGLEVASLNTAGTQTIFATDTVATTLTGVSNPISVSAAAAHQFSVTANPNPVFGSAFVVTVVSQDQYGNTAVSYAGTAHFTSSDSRAVLPANTTLAAGIGLFSVTLKTIGVQTITVTDATTSTIAGASSGLLVSAAPASHFMVSSSGTATAGAGIILTVTALDQFNNTSVGYAGTVVFAASDNLASLLPSTLTSGVGTFSVTLKTAGVQFITATDSVTGSMSGASNPIAVGAAAAARFLVNVPNSFQAGQLVFLTVTAEDRFNNVATSYGGNVALTCSASEASLSGPSPLTSGVGVFGAVLEIAGNQTITATDTVTSTISGASIAITVTPGALNQLGVSGPSNPAVGSVFALTVTAQDQYGNTVPNYSGTVHFTSGDTRAVLPVNNTLAQGIGLFSVTLETAALQSITAIDTVSSSVTGSAVLNASAGPVTHFVFNSASNTTAGTGVRFTLIAEDQFNNTATSYAGTVHFTSSDSQAALPADTMLTSGTGNFVANLKTAGSERLTATDVTSNTITGASVSINVVADPVDHFSVAAALPVYAGITSGPNSFATTGVPTAFTVSAVDFYGNAVPSYAGTVQLSSSDSAAVLPLTGNIAGGLGIFSATLMTASNQTLSASNAVNGLKGTSSSIMTRGLVVNGFATTPSGFSISFNKPFNPGSVLMYTTGTTPDDIVLATAGSQISVRGSALFNATDTGITFIKTDSITSSGTFNPANGLLAAGKYTLTLRSLTAAGNGFQDALATGLDGNNSGGSANYVMTFSVSAPPLAVGIPDFARGPSNTDALFLPSTLTNGGTFALSYTNPAAHPATGTAFITFSTTATTLASNIQAALSSGGLATQVGVNSGAGNTPNSVVVVTTDTSTGANVLVTFQSALATATTQILSSSTAGVTIGPATINVANNIPGDGIPIALSSGLNVTSGSFTLQYNPSLLSITGAVSKVAGASFALVSNDVIGGTAVLSFSSPTSLSSTATAITVGSLLATVPLSATGSYGAKQLLHFSGEQVNGISGPLAVTNADGLQLLAYFGHVTASGSSLNLSDSTAVFAVAEAVPNATAQTMPGFAAYPNLDPAIIGDVSLQGSVSSTDAGALLQEVGGQARITIPYAPIGLAIAPVGPDPTLSVGGGRWTVDGGSATLVVPVDIDTARPAGSDGMVDAVVALSYNPKLFDISASDIQLGTVPLAGSGWQLETEINPETGLIGIELFSDVPIASAVGGSLVTITMHSIDGVPANAAALQIVPFADPAGGLRVYQTQVSDAVGAFVLHTEVDVGTKLIALGDPGNGGLVASVPSSDTRANVPETNRLTTPLVDRVFGDSDELAFALQLISPVSQLSAANASSKPDWPPIDFIADFAQAPAGGFAASLTNSPDSDTPAGDANNDASFDTERGTEVGLTLRKKQQHS